ncbi:MAG: ion transporter [Cytophagaceae bacterium]
MIVLGFLWIILLIIEFIYGQINILSTAGLVIWGIFIVDFIIRFIVAPKKASFLKTNVITIISLFVPAFRVFRILYVLRFARSLRLVKVIGSLNRGIRILTATMQRRALGYVVAITLLVLFVGAAGMHAFERHVNPGMETYVSSLWWTGMILTTMGSDFWPVTLEGRILCFLMAVYAFAVFGYVTASIASFFIESDAQHEGSELAGAKQIESLRKEIQELKELIKATKK